MKITQLKQLQLEVILDFDDFKRLDRGEIIGDRYEAENKLIIHMIHPCGHSWESIQASSKKREYAELNRYTEDIDIYIPQGVLRDSRISASRFIPGLNFQITPWELGDPFADAHIRMVYPGSLKIIDLSPTYEKTQFCEK